jgi:tetrapyrrole methylase family protein / MazG family protein
MGKTKQQKVLRGKQRGSGKPKEKKQLTSGEWFEKLVAVQARLRALNGCPWDREQTHQTLRTYLIEEAYEVLEALESKDDAKFAEELGDVLLQIVFHSQIAKEQGRFQISDVIREIHDKMVRRHPHVFGSASAKNSAEVLRKWEQIKAEERASTKPKRSEAEKAVNQEPSLLEGVTRGLPATLEGFQLTRRAARVGFDWDDAQGILEKIKEEAAEMEETLDSAGSQEKEEELGDLLFAVVNLARFLHLDPEIALKKANHKFSRRFRVMEEFARQQGIPFKELPRAQMEELWRNVKSQEKGAAVALGSAANFKR